MARKRRLRRGIYLLPTVFTVGNLFCGFSSVVQASVGALEWAALLIIVAGLLDGLDGRIARLTGSTSEFGVEFDSLADIVSFGIAPAFLLHTWALMPLRRLGWMIAFLFVVCAAMRLARFTIQRAAADKRYFLGLPTPAAAAFLAGPVYMFPSGPAKPWVSGIVAVLVVAVAMLMISRLRYRSFKDLDLRNRRSYIYVFPLAVMVVALLTHPAITVVTLMTAYLLSGPVGLAWGLATRGRRHAEATAAESGRAGEVLDGPPAR
jgi:CDP-diacylglycerol--serine O-phosphatidyltransferase